MKTHLSLGLLKIGLFFVLLATIGACSLSKPEGPGEKIGRGLDEVFGGIRDMDSTRGQGNTKQEESPRAKARDQYKDLDRPYDDTTSDLKAKNKRTRDYPEADDASYEEPPLDEWR